MPQSLSNILVHLVFSTKHQSPWLKPENRAELFPYFTGILKNVNSPVLQIGGVEDHVHLLFRLSRTLTVSQTVEKLKVGSAKWMKAKWPDIDSFSWQGGYGAFSAGPGDAGAIVKYIRTQEDHHRRFSFQEEFRRICQEYGVEIDERYVWD